MSGHERPMARRRLVLALAAIVAVAGGGAAVTAVTAVSAPDRSQDGSGSSADSEGLPPATAPVTRGDLSDSSQQDGTLGHLGERKINAGPAGVLTWVASPARSSGGTSGCTRSRAARSGCCTAPNPCTGH